MHIVIAIEKWCDLNPNLGNTSAHSNVIGSLKCANIGTYDVFHYDEYLMNNNHPIDDLLLDHVKNKPTDLVFVSYYPFIDQRNISLITLHKIRDLGIPVVFIWFDFVHQIIKDTVYKVYGAASLNIIVDVYDKPNDKFLPLWVPQDESLFRPGNKDIDISFVGSRNGYTERNHYLSFLPNVQISGGQREHKLTIEEYAEVLGRSKTTLNFPGKQDGCIQAKSRIYEAMLSGAMLLEKENDCITRWFEPMKHYVPFVNEQDMVDKVNYYVASEERQIIADQALHKMKTDYNSTNWWMTIINESKKCV